MLRSDFSDVERHWRRRRLFGPTRPQSRPGLWLVAGGLLASGMYLAAQTILPLGPGKSTATATPLLNATPAPPAEAGPAAGLPQDREPDNLPLAAHSP